MKKYYKYVDTPWTQPVLSANGTMGGDSFACAASTEYDTSRQAWLAFNGVSSGMEWQASSTTMPQWIAFYNPTPLNVTQIICTTNSSWKYMKDYTVQGSNDYNTWTDIVSGTGAATTTIDMSSNTEAYNYYRIYVSSITGGSSSVSITILEMQITATQRVIEEIDNPHDVEHYYLYDTENPILNITKVGSPTITGAVASNFAANSYVKLPTNPNFSGCTSFELCVGFTTGNDVSTNQYLTGNESYPNDPIGLYVSSGTFKVQIVFDTSGSSYTNLTMSNNTITTNTYYIAKLTYNSSTGYKAYLSIDDGETFYEVGTSSSTTRPFTSQFTLGSQRSSNEMLYYWYGSIDLLECYIKINDEYFWQGATIPIRELTKVSDNEYTYDIPWTQPVLSANGTLGGDSFAVESSSQYSSFSAYYAFDNNNSTYWQSSSSEAHPYLILYNPVPLKLSKITITNVHTGSAVFNYGVLYGSNDNSTWETLGTLTATTTVNGATWDTLITTNNFYKYFKLGDMTNANYATGGLTAIGEISLTATYQITTDHYDFTRILPNWDYYIEIPVIKSSEKFRNNYYKYDYESPSYNYTTTGAGGTLTNTTGVLSGFATNSYATTSKNFFKDAGVRPWEMVWCFETGSNISTSQGLVSFGGSGGTYQYGVHITIQSNTVLCSFSVGSNVTYFATALSVQTNTKYWIKYKYTGSRYEVYLSTSSTFSDTPDAIQNYSINFAYNSSYSCNAIGINMPNEMSPRYAFQGKVYLADCYIILAGEDYWNGVDYPIISGTPFYYDYYIKEDIFKGLITSNKNKRFYKTGYGVNWIQPILSSVGTWGESDMAVKASPNATHGSLISAFNKTGRVAWINAGSTINIDISISSKLCPTSITCVNWHDGSTSFGATGFTVKASNDYETWDTLGSASLSLSTGATGTVSPTTDTYYQYIRLVVSASSLNGYQATLQGITLTGTTSGTEEVLNPSLSPVRHYYKYDTETPIYNFTTVGTLTNNDGVISGFSTSNYGQGTVNPLNAIASASSFEFVAGFTTGADISTYQTVLWQGVSKQALGYNAIGINVYNGKISYIYSYNSSNQGKSGTYSIQANTSYIIKITFDGSSVNGYYSTDGGETFTLDVTMSTSTKLTTSTRPFTVGVSNQSSPEYPFYGSIDLKKCYIKINDEMFWQGVTYPVIDDQGNEEWIPPVLTANGTMGGDEFAVDASSVSSGHTEQYAWKQFANSAWIGGTVPQWYTFYSPNPLNIKELVLSDNNNTTVYLAKDFTFQGSNDNNEWTTLYTNNTRTTGNLTINLSNNNDYYKYHRFYITSVGSGTDTLLKEFVSITATIHTTPASPTNYDYYVDTYNWEYYTESSEIKAKIDKLQTIIL